MAPPDQGSGGASPPAAAALRRQTSCSGSPPQHERRRLSSAASFSSPAPSSASTTDSSYHPAPSHKSSSCESIPFAADELGLGSNKLSPSLSSSASSSSSSYESFLHIDPDCLDFDEPAAAAAAYDPKRLPSAMFRTRSTNPAEWSVTSNDSLFSIQLSSSSAGSARYGDVIYYDAAGGFPRFPSMGMMREPSSVSSVSSSGGLCLREDCARCNGTGSTVRKAVRFAAATECISYGDSNRAAGLPTANATAASTANTTPEAAAGWCQFACCWPSLPTLWWPRCCAWNCHCCSGCWG